MAEPLSDLITRTKAACEDCAARLRADAEQFDVFARDCASWIRVIDDLTPQDVRTIRKYCRYLLNACSAKESQK